MCNIYMLINKHHKLYTILSITQIKQYKILFQRNYTIDQNQNTHIHMYIIYIYNDKST